MEKPKICEQCGKEKRLVGHHYNYNKPDEKTWLCYKCHSKVHYLEKDKIIGKSDRNQVMIRMPEELREKALAEAEKKLLSLSDIIRIALLEFLQAGMKKK